MMADMANVKMTKFQQFSLSSCLPLCHKNDLMQIAYAKET